MANNTLSTKIQLRRDTAANWATLNPILLLGEQGLELDTGFIKIGDGSTVWNNLTYQKVEDSHKLDGKHLSDIVLNTSSPTVTDATYSCKFIDDTKMPIAFATRYYWWKTGTTTADLDGKPTLNANNFLTLTTTNQTIDWNSSNKLVLTRTSANVITFNQDSIFNQKVYCSFDRNCVITFGFRRFAGGVQIASNDTKVISFQTNVITAIDLQIISNLLTGNTSYPAGTIFTDEIFIAGDTPAAIVSKFYCGVEIGGIEYYSWHNLSAPSVYLNTDQIANQAITIEKLAQETINYIETKADENQTINYDLSAEPTETGSKTKTSTILWQNIFSHTNFLWGKIKDLFSPIPLSVNDGYLTKIDDINKKLVKSNIQDDDNRISLEKPLRVNFNTFYNVAQYNNVSGAITGTIYIEMPFGLSVSSMGTYEIDVYDFGSYKAKIIVSGYFDATGWNNSSLQIVGNLPSNIIRLGYNSDDSVEKVCILIGNTNTLWQFPQVYVSKVTQGYTNTADWSTGWSISLIDAAYESANITNIVQPTANVGMMLDGKTLTDQIADNDGRYLGLTAKAADSEKLDGKDSTEFSLTSHNHTGVYATSAQGAKADTAIQGVKNGSTSLIPDANRVVTLPVMVGATSGANGVQGLVPTPTAGQQNLFLKGDGTFTSPTSDIITVASYVVGTSTGATFTQNASNINVVLTSNYVSYIANPAIPNIVEVFYNGSKLLVNTDFTINTSGGNAITILNYTLVNTDVIVINYKTAIGSYGSVFQSAVDNCITVTNNVNTINGITPFITRVEADGGVVRNKQFLVEFYEKHRNLLPNCKLLLCPEIGVKTDTTAGSTTISKLYDLSANNNDAVQNTKANQPFLGGFIAPNEKYSLSKITGDTALRRMSHSNISFLATDQWSLTMSFMRTSYGNLIYSTNGNDQINFQNGYIAIHKDIAGVNTNIFFSYCPWKLNVNNIFTINYNNGLYSFYLNGVSYNSSIQVSSAITFKNIYLDTYSRAINIKYYSILNRVIEAKEIQDLTTFLSTSFPDIESIPVGYQQIATSNFEGIVNGNGDTILEVQPNTLGSELITNGTFDTDTSWPKDTGWTISGGKLVATNVPYGSAVSQIIGSTIGKVFKVTFDCVVTSGGFHCEIGGYNEVRRDITASGSYTVYGRRVGTVASNSFYFYGDTTFTGTIDNVSVKQCGWAESTEIYNYYKNTLGKSEYESCLAASMWCYYDNDILNGAIYGKLYNWYAVYALNYYPPQGWRVLSYDDFVQLSNQLGGNSVAGGKMKLQGTTYWNSPNMGATNESGLSRLGTGKRLPDGTFNVLKSYNIAYCIDNATFIGYDGVNTGAASEFSDKRNGLSLYLMKNSPYGETDKELETGYFTTNIAAGTANKDLVVPFGYRIASVRVESISALTNFKCDLYSTSGVLQDTLLTGKSVSANVAQTFIVTADHKTQATNPFLRFNATGNTGMRIYVQLEKIIL